MQRASSRRWAARLVAAAMVLALGAGTFAGGRSYVWCIPKQRVMPKCCMQAMRDHPDFSQWNAL